MRRAFFGRTDGIAAKTAGGGVPRIDGGIKMEFRRPRHRGAHHHPGSTPKTEKEMAEASRKTDEEEEGEAA